MGHLAVRIRNLGYLAGHFRFSEILRKLSHRLSSDSYAYGLRRDLANPCVPPEAQIPLTVRALRESDLARIFVFNRSGQSPEDVAELESRLEHIYAAIPTCYVAVSEDDIPTYIQWLMGSQENERIQAYFNGIFPILSPDEALLENAFTLREFRGKGIMAAAMARIAEQGSGIGARSVITFVDVNNIASLKGCRRAGFHPYTLRHERWRLFRRELTFSGIPQPSEVIDYSHQWDQHVPVGG